MTELLTVQEAASLLGVTAKTIRRWEKEGKIRATRTAGGHRRFDNAELLKLSEKESLSVGYARVGSEEQQEQLGQQVAILQAYRDRAGGKWEIIQDVGSGANYRNRGLLRLLDLLCHQRLQRLVLPHKCRLLRLGFDLILKLCEIFQVEVVILNSPEARDTEEEWEQDEEEIAEQLNAQLNSIHQQQNRELKQQLQAKVSGLG